MQIAGVVPCIREEMLFVMMLAACDSLYHRLFAASIIQGEECTLLFFMPCPRTRHGHEERARPSKQRPDLIKNHNGEMMRMER